MHSEDLGIPPADTMASVTYTVAATKEQLEVFIEHIPRTERQARMHAVQLQST